MEKVRNRTRWRAQHYSCQFKMCTPKVKIDVPLVKHRQTKRPTQDRTGHMPAMGKGMAWKRRVWNKPTNKMQADPTESKIIVCY